MSKSYWLTPEEMIVRKKKKKGFIYISFMLGTILLSALVTILANQI